MFSHTFKTIIFKPAMKVHVPGIYLTSEIFDWGQVQTVSRLPWEKAKVDILNYNCKILDLNAGNLSGICYCYF